MAQHQHPAVTSTDGDPMSAITGWEAGIERAIQRVIAGMTMFYSVVAVSWAGAVLATDHRDTATLMAAGVLCLVVISVRAWKTRITFLDIAVANLAMVALLHVNARVGTDGIGIQAGPAYVFMTTSLLLAALTLSWSQFWVCASVTTTVYVVGRFLGGTQSDLLSGLDEAISDTSTIAAAGLILAFYRRAGRRADAALRVRLEAGRREAVATAAERAAAERRRLLHDEIIAALVTIDHAGPVRDAERASEVAARARRALRAGTATPPTAHAAPGLINTNGIHIPVTVEIDPGLATETSSLPEVTAAISGAVNEALRNVERHARATSVQVSVTRHGAAGVRVLIEDDGLGLGPGFTPGFGIRQSIMGRMGDIGGSASVRPRDGAGTTVELLWDGHQAGPDAPRPEETTAALSSTRRFTYFVTTVALVGQLWLIARHLHRPLEVLVALLAIALIVAAAWLASHRPVGFAMMSAIVVAGACLLLWGLAAAERGALLDFRSWIVELTCVPIFTLSFFVSFRALMAYAAVLAAVMVAWCGYDPAVTVAGASDPILQPLFYAAALGATAWGFRAVSTSTTREERVAAHRVMLEALAAARTQQSEKRLAHLRTRLDPFLASIEHRALDISEPEVIDHARALALEVRDEMYLPGLLDDELRLFLATARESGTSITIRHAELDSIDQAVATMLRAAIDPSKVSTATLSLPGTGAPYIRLVILPAADASTNDRLVRDLGPIGAVVETTEHATVLTVAAAFTPVSPEGGPPHEPS